MLIGRKAHEILVILLKEDLGLDYRQREESKKLECPAGNHNQKYPQSAYEECRNSGPLVMDVDVVWNETFQGGKLCTGKNNLQER